jgi:hypothetical protein
MLKLLIVFPFLLVGGAVALGLVVPLLALLPVALAIGAGFFALFAVIGILGVLARLFAGLVIGIGGLFAAMLGFGFLFAGGALVLALGFALAHLLLPLLVIALIVWLVRRSSRPTPALPAPHG